MTEYQGKCCEKCDPINGRAGTYTDSMYKHAACPCHQSHTQECFCTLLDKATYHARDNAHSVDKRWSCPIHGSQQRYWLIHKAPQKGCVKCRQETQEWEKNLRGEIMQALGAASMCWTETPKGIFATDRAIQIGEELLSFIRQLLAKERHAAYRRGIEVSIGNDTVKEIRASALQEVREKVENILKNGVGKEAKIILEAVLSLLKDL